jgi:serine/threonine-protein kinase
MGTFSGAGGPLFAAPFDARSLTAGPSVPVIDGVMHYSLSESGVLVYTTRPAGAGRRPVELVWVTRNGDVQPVQDGWEFDRGEGNEYGWRLSPDGGRIALQMSAEGQTGIWIKEVSGGRPRRLNLDEGAQRAPSWHPDGQSVVYLGSDDSGVREPWTHRADFTGLATPLLRGRRFSNVTWSPTSEWLVLTTYYSAGQYAQADLLAYRPEDGRLDSLVATSDYAEWEPAVSPDGRWLAYSANEEGDFEVYVRPFPDIGAGKFRISLDGGRSPRWAHTGRELFFVSGDRLLSASIELEREPRAARIDTLFAIAPGFVTDIGSNFYDVDSDDQRFLMARGLGPDGAEGSPRFVVVLNFDEVLRTRVPK